MFAWLRWYLVVQLLGASALPLAWRLFHRLPDRGYFVVKPLAILLHSLVLWLGVSYGLLRNELGGAVLAVAVVAALAWRGGRRGTVESVSLRDWLREHRALVIGAEALFFVAFAAWGVVRAHDAAADHTERPMDLLFVSGIHASPTFPPRDPWLAGHAISYYYMGYWMLNALGLLAGQRPEVAYNLGLACWFALLVSGCFGMAYDLVRVDRPASRRTAVAAGGLAAITVGLAGNPQGTLDVLQRLRLDLSGLASGRAAYNFAAPSHHWWWWRASRVLEDRDAAGRHVEVIDEFPAFGYLVGDAHPHLLAMPYAILVLFLALGIHLAAGDRHHAAGSRSAWRTLLERIPLGGPGLIVLVVAVGALLFLNTWDFPVQWLIVVLAYAGAGSMTAPSAADGRGLPAWRTTVLLGGVLLAGSLLLYLPYLLTAQSQAEGIHLNRSDLTPPFQMLLMFGPLLLGVVALSSMGASWGRCAGVGALLLAVLWLGPTLLIVGLLLVVVALRLRSATREARPGFAFALLLASVGLLLVLAPEVAFIQDSFGTRMNTVFKTYHLAWLLLGLATAYGAIVSLGSEGPARWLGGAAALLVTSGLLYTGAAVSAVTEGFNTKATLDALAYIRTASPAEGVAIDWIQRQTPKDALVVQGSGSSYRPDQCRVSVATGRPTLLGWEGHELQWRGRAFAAMAAGRGDVLETIYRRGRGQELTRTLESWGIDYVFVGPAERERYGIDAGREEEFARVGDLAFSEGSVRIYRRRGARAVPSSR